jgi:3-oxoacyl-(acyl-carrier-protein) synthase
MAVVLGTGWISPDRDFDVTEHLALRGLRPLARASQLACVAAAAALRHPEPLPATPERCAVVLGTRFASIEPLVEFNRVAVTDGPGLVNPSSFPNVVVNAHAGYLGILFGLAGPNVTLCGEAAGLEALGQALDLLELGRADAVLAGGVEAYGETLFEGLRRAGAEEPKEAAAFVLLSRDGLGPTLDRAQFDALAAAGGAGAAGVLDAVRATSRMLKDGRAVRAVSTPSAALRAATGA